ncbi:OmpA family protein [Mucilaginibacter ginkgonis]|uniref:OmpA family protein n=1 Tax=Mucilaginibacter ginkgonis TaxID=2682091 RepID=A0A6I4HUJ2_9SPHI|nr:OmpA family protein [Mucilaginibacter ginkgonis]QQL50413.1 OmpA family protein [Mucilaginibacter ginkgonis]
MKKYLLILLMGLIACSASAQYENNVKQLADKAFATGKYYEAAYYYKKLADGLKITGMGEIPYEGSNKSKPNKKNAGERLYVMFRLAESYRLYQNFLEAEGWYLKLLNQPDNSAYPLARLWYGVCLRANQHFEEAIKQLQMFDSAYTGDKQYSNLAKHEIANCRFALEQMQFPGLYLPAKLKSQFNSDGSNYALTAYGDQYLFTSSRSVGNDKRHLNKVYTVARAEGSQPAILPLTIDDGKKNVELGTPSLNGAGNRLYFTRWYTEGNKTHHIIYISEKNGSSWSTRRPLNKNVNADGFDAIQPFATADGKKIFYASNKPGGHGGYDIWMSELDPSGNSINSFNLGSVINTEADEQAPFMSGNKLIYSSKGFTGLGGFDLFETYSQNGKWQTPLNMGSPVNSAKDDLYYFPNPADARKFFISSDRESDCCLDLFTVADQSFSVAGNVVDCETGKPITGVKVSLKDSLTKNVISVMSLEKVSSYTFKIRVKRPMVISFEKPGYFAGTFPVLANGTDTLRKLDACMQSFVVGKPIALKNILFDFGHADLRPESEKELNHLVGIMKDNPALKVELSAHTDSIGSDAYNLKLSQDRAQSCVNYITSKGIDESRIFARGYGRSRPVAPNSLPNGADNPEGRQKNRRLEFTALKENR